MWRRENSARYVAHNPNIATVNFYDVARFRTVDEFVMSAEKFIPVIEKCTGRKSLWIGKIILRDDCNPYKDWNCDIILLSNSVDHILIHEIIHS